MKLLCIFMFCTSILLGFAQQDPQYTQYMYNMSLINPAYAGSKEDLSLGLLYRNQWTGVDGAPETGTFFAHSSIGNNVGIGLSGIVDQIGPVKETNTYIDVSYTLNLAGEQRLAFGLKAGATFHDIGLSTINVIDETDPFFSQDSNEVTPNVGIGAFYYANNYYLALSVPNLLSSVHLDANGFKIGSETQHYFLTGGYVFDLSSQVKLKPSFLVKSAFNASTSFDINLNALYLDTFEIGASYRLDDSFSALVGLQVTPSIRIGYAYDFISTEIRAFAPASHELLLLFDFNLPRKAPVSPRYF